MEVVTVPATPDGMGGAEGSSVLAEGFGPVDKHRHGEQGYGVKDAYAHQDVYDAALRSKVLSQTRQNQRVRISGVGKPPPFLDGLPSSALRR